jgi:DNA-binding response OmpR family regulator
MPRNAPVLVLPHNSRCRCDHTHVILLDLGMPGNGLTVAKHARALGHKPIVITVSGYGSEEARGLADQAGASMYLLKPVNIDLLQQILARIRDRRLRVTAAS